MIKKLSKRALSLLLVFVMLVSMLPAMVFADDLTLDVTDLAVSYDGSNETVFGYGGSYSCSGSGTSIEAKATSYYKNLWLDWRLGANVTVTLKNNMASSAVLTFNYTTSTFKNSTLTMNGTAVSGTGTAKYILAAGKSISIVLNSTVDSDTNTAGTTSIKLTNISLVEYKTAVTTFVPAENGSYTVSNYNTGTLETPEMQTAAKTVSEQFTSEQSSAEPYTLTATPAPGYKFVAWIDPTTNEYLNLSSSYTLYAGKDQSITAYFVPTDTGVYSVEKKLYDDLDEAIAYAQSINCSNIFMVGDGTLTGNHTIPAGYTLVIPNDANLTAYTDTPLTDAASLGTLTPYHTLTMAAGSTLTVNGNLSLGGHYTAAAGSSAGSLNGGYGKIQMADSSTITVNNGGTLYAWGFISGSGSVSAESGSKVYEWFQVADFRGGSATTSMSNNVFPFNQYFVQNVEVPLTIQAGADEVAYTSATVGGETSACGFNFIGTSGMFKLVSGSFTKDYDEAADRMIFTIDGEAQLNPIELSFAGMAVKSKNYVLPINNNITMNLTSGALVNVNQDIELLPGVQVNIAEDANLIVSEGYSAYIYDLTEWTTDSGTAVNYSLKGNYTTTSTQPGRTGKRSALTDAQVTVNGTLTAAGNIYTTSSGADIRSDGKGSYVQQSTAPSDSTTYQYTQEYVQEGTTSKLVMTAHSIAVASAWLHNGATYAGTEDEYTKTTGTAAGTTIKYVSDKWGGEETHEHTYGTPVFTWSEDNTTCTAVFTCTDESCPDTDGKKEISVECTVSSERVEPGCETDGSITYKAIAKLNDTEYSDSKVVTLEKTGHQWDAGTVTTAATCESDGVITYTCQNDNSHTKTESIPATGHDWDNGTITTAATCTSDGVMTYTCKNDSTHTKTEAISAEGHTSVEVKAVAPTCTEAGATAGTKCSVCGAILSGCEEIPAIGHDWDTGVVTTEATCETDGVKTYTCQNDTSHTYTESIPATGHTYGEPNFVWNEDNTASTAVFTCTACAKSESVVCGITTEIIVAPTLTEVGTQNVTASVTWNDQTYTETKTIELPATGITVTWVVDGVTSTEVYESGAVPVFKGSTVKENDDNYKYEFTGWYPEINEDTVVTEPVTYTAQYTQTALAKYTISFDANGGTGTMEPQTFVEGKSTAISANAFTRAGYTFAGWNTEADGTGITYTEQGAILALEQDITLYAQWTPDTTYTVLWKNYDGTELEKDENVAPGTIPEYNGTTPTRATDDTYSYTFSGWDPAVSAVTGDAVYTAQYDEVLAYYRVQLYYNVDGTEISAGTTKNYAVGKGIKMTAGSTYTKDGATYNFDHWELTLDGSENTITYSSAALTINPTVGGTYIAKACYVPNVVEEKATVEVVSATAEKVSGKYKVSLTESWNVPEGYTVVKTGFVVATKTGTTLEYGATGTASKASKLTTTDGAYTLKITIGTDPAKSIYARAFLTYKDAYGNEATIYSQNETTAYSYNTLNGNS